MKALKVKFGLFSLLAVLAVSVFLTSCEQDDIINVAEEQTFHGEDRMLLLMPHGFEALSKEEQIEYFENLTEEGYAKLAENHRVGSYLRHVDKYWDISNRMEEGQLVLDMDLSSVLTNEEVVALTNYQYNNIAVRSDCGNWSFIYSYYDYHQSPSVKICTYKRLCEEETCCSTLAWYEYTSNTSCTPPGVMYY